MFARRQFEHGDNLSQRTFRVRHTTQLRSSNIAWELLPFGAFSEGEAEATALAAGIDAQFISSDACDILCPSAEIGPLCSD